MEEKLNIIFEKLLEIEGSMNEEKYQQKLKELECKKKEVNYQIEDLEYARKKVLEDRAEMIHRFRNCGQYGQVEEIE